MILVITLVHAATTDTCNSVGSRYSIDICSGNGSRRTNGYLQQRWFTLCWRILAATMVHANHWILAMSLVHAQDSDTCSTHGSRCCPDTCIANGSRPDSDTCWEAGSRFLNDTCGVPDSRILSDTCHLHWFTPSVVILAPIHGSRMNYG